MVASAILPVLALCVASVLAQNAQDTISKNVVALSGDAAAHSQKNYRFNTLVKLATDTKLVPALDTANITLFAPTDDAFKALTSVPSDLNLVADILTYHVVPGAFPADKLAAYQVVPTLLNRQGSPFVQFADNKTAQSLAVAKADGVTVSFGLGKVKVIDSIPSANGVIHVVDGVLLPPKKPSETAVAAKLNQLVAALTKAQLVSAVDGAKGVTIFAPTDAAFDKIKDTVAKLTDEQLKQVLTYHVVPTVAYSTGLPASLDAPTLLGADAKVAVKKTAEGVTVNGAKVVIADVFTNNGVVHVIDSVLIPPSLAGGSAATGSDKPAQSTTSPATSATGTASAQTGDASATKAALGLSAAVALAAAVFA
ncbi:FAS1 domain-containing protein [Catenaria anguillulae PL171]|uniref:FAS1 domain-containing protein n=1 Tax=Catenaria anguillulae PL171 TaxID=765915 RepID=A0A1Y2HQU7_9FUNG|nr:FAS1 domain-containing protein [Catenaria anguillulae PL171]